MLTVEEIEQRLNKAWAEAYEKEYQGKSFTEAVRTVADLMIQKDELLIA